MPDKEQNRNVSVMPGRVKIADTARNYWVVTVEQGITRDDLKRPEFWSLVAKNFRPYDRIEARADDGTFFSEYLVITADRAWAKVHELRYEPLGTQDVSLTEAATREFRERFYVKFNGPHLKWCVERKDGSKVERMKEGFADKGEAQHWLTEHLKTVAGTETVAA